MSINRYGHRDGLPLKTEVASIWPVSVVNASAEENAIYSHVASNNDPTSCSIKLSHSQSKLLRDLWKKRSVCGSQCGV